MKARRYRRSNPIPDLGLWLLLAGGTFVAYRLLQSSHTPVDTPPRTLPPDQTWTASVWDPTTPTNRQACESAGGWWAMPSEVGLAGNTPICLRPRTGIAGG